MSKGKRRERQAGRAYTEAGYATFRPQESKFGETDIFGLFDLLAIGFAPDPTHLVQVKSNRAEGVEDWAEQARGFEREGIRARMLVCHDREGWRVIEPRPHPAEYEIVRDCRDADAAMGEALAAFLREE
jgi:Holliday junction resolvase